MIRKEIQNRQKIINDPVFGFIQIPFLLLYEIIEQPCFQRLKRIRQLGLTNLVFPGAQHTRFQHALGAMHLMNEAIKTLRSKGHEITEEEEIGALAAILLHDVGHGPFSHLLEDTIVRVSHETISLSLMRQLNQKFEGKLDLAIQIFTNKYPKKFLHQLISSQLDMDRMDYLRRDSFFTGVTEGTIGSARIIKMLNVSEDQLVIDAKGIFSIETFLVARRMMYWQVYLHKTSIAIEQMLVKTLLRAKSLIQQGEQLFATPAFYYFLSNEISADQLESDTLALRNFALLDDVDVFSALKVWQHHPDTTLSLLAAGLINRVIYKIELHTHPIENQIVEQLKIDVVEKLGIPYELSHYFVFSDKITTNLYSTGDEQIKILYKSGKVEDFSQASDLLNQAMLTTKTERYYLCYYKL